MKVVAIIGSPHGMKGNTGQLLQPVLKAAQAAGAKAETFSLAEMEVQPCRGCGTCHETGQCPIQDDFSSIESAMLAADGLVLASPNYMFSVTAQMKAFIDRSSGTLHCQRMEGKYAAAVVTAGGDCEEVEEYLLRFLRAMGCWSVASVGAVAGRMADKAGRKELFKKAAALGERVVEAIRTKEAFPEQQAERSAFYDRMKTLIAARAEEWPFEYEYWKSRGRL